MFYSFVENNLLGGGYPAAACFCIIYAYLCSLAFFSASAFEDFTPASRLVTLPPTADSNGSVACTTFEMLEDKIAFEGGERIRVVIVLPPGNATQLGDNSTAWVVINDNDGEGHVNI